ncbi:MAG: hypothetical protein HC923_04870 [Myxococcales bacterium]|nr:hypothetical protein [Myxococcales bacterium]
MIEDGANLLLAGSEPALRALPRGSWIGGTIPYFMTEKGGVLAESEIYANRLPDGVSVDRISSYDAVNLSSVYEDAPADGISFIVMPYGSEAHAAFAQGAPRYPAFATRPLVGWVSGVNLQRLGVDTPKVFDGASGTSSSENAVVLHAKLPAGIQARIDIVNLFEQDDSDVLTFAEEGFSTREAYVNGLAVPLVDYLDSRSLKSDVPLVSSSYGAQINVSIRSIDRSTGMVSFYAPVFKETDYRFARPIKDYAHQFREAVSSAAKSSLFACNCILNYLYGNLRVRPCQAQKGP